MGANTTTYKCDYHWTGSKNTTLRTLIVGGSAANGGYAGLGDFLSDHGVSHSAATVGFRSVSSRKIAEHISKYFGRLVFDLMYGESNCDYEWID